MIAGFKDQFVPFVEEGSKTHTIRAGKRWRVGMRVDAFARPRQKGMRLLGRWLCVKVEEIQIVPFSYRKYPIISVNAQPLSMDECQSLAWRDGFRSRGAEFAFDEMMRFWKGRLPFTGQIVHWRYSTTWEQKTKSSSRSAKSSGRVSRTSRSCPKKTKRIAG